MFWASRAIENLSNKVVHLSGNKLSFGVALGFGLVELGPILSHHQGIDGEISRLKMVGEPEALL